MGIRHELFSAGCFIRGSALGGTLLIAALGAFAADPHPGPAAFTAVLVVGLCFHTFAYVTNDLVDLPLDRVARPISPLVVGWIPTRTALAVALVQVPVALGVALVVGGLRAASVMVAALAAMAVYNLYGKRAPAPPLTDAVQGVSWSALLLAAAAMVGDAWTPIIWTFAAFVVVFILMANGIHGSIRDLVIDRQFGVRSTAIVYGAHPRGQGGVFLPRGLVVYASALQVAAFSVLWASVIRDDLSYSRAGSRLVASLLLILTVLSSRFLLVALRSEDDGRALRSAGMLHLVTLLAVPVVLLLPRLHGGVIAALAVLYVVPLLPHHGLPDTIRWGRERARTAAARATRRVGSSR